MNEPVLNPLAKGWIRCSVDDVTLPVRKIDLRSEPARRIDYLDISGIDNALNVICDAKSYQLKEAPSRARQIVHEGDVLFSTVRPYLRNIAPVPSKYDAQIGSTGFSVLRPAAGLDARFLFYCCISSEFVNAVSGKQYGVSYPAVKREQVREQIISLPPYNEQRRIVAKIEELFSELDKGVESLTAAREQLKVYRQAMLKHAFEGKLTARWREENKDKLETADQLLARIKTEREGRYELKLSDWNAAVKVWKAKEQKGKKPAKPGRPVRMRSTQKNYASLPSCWGLAYLESLAYEAVLGKMLDKGKNKGRDRLYLGNINLRWGSFNLSHLKSMKIEDNEIPRYSLSAGDLVICEGGEPGRCAVWDGEENVIFIQKALHRVRFTESYDPYFALYYIQYAATSGLLDEHFTGTTIRHLTGKRLSNVIMPLCGLSEQRKIVENLEKIFSRVRLLEDEIETNALRAQALRQSVLKKAFSGELVAQDADDEPASVLLERIRAGKAAQVKPGRKRGKRTSRGSDQVQLSDA